MIDTLDDRIQYTLVTGQPTHHEAAPEDFGADTGRWSLLRECLALLLARHDGLRIEVIGSLDTLRKFALVPGQTRAVGDATVPVFFGRTERSGVIRFQFSRTVAQTRFAGRPSPALAARKTRQADASV